MNLSVNKTAFPAQQAIPKQLGSGGKETILVSKDTAADTEIAASSNINWKYVALVVATLAAFFLMIKVVSEPVEPIIIMDEPVSSAQQAVTPKNSADTMLQNPPATAGNLSEELLLPNESIATLPLPASAEVPVLNEVAATEAEKSVTQADVVHANKTPQQLTDIELAKKKAKQKAKKKTEEAIQQSTAATNSQPQSQPQQSIVVQQKEPAVVAVEAKKDTSKEAAKDTVKASEQEKSPWSKIADSIKQGGEIPCSPAQIAMNQCH